MDHYWDKLSAGGEEKRCGWLKDKFGVVWQVSPFFRFPILLFISFLFFFFSFLSSLLLLPLMATCR